ncbi:hypothetical protein [Litchfieldia salsa]|uniref:Uncharacterized protein n=1 Tax=Litchfieldia salsa TaxID=930152 RepID=A0A1H0VPX1_9BACI|nr:hypothetical protein [Litchfieldia salsa]SDP80228.1 hypothetical protein SAMN05216565_107117 [Litchfieldia salsa]
MNHIALLLFEIKGIVDSISDIQEYEESIPSSLVERLQERVNEAVGKLKES